ncbi:hypothetical protein EEA47_03170 [Vibrio alginolyticus]|uniref:hypothetical protein n=1 Tax=Vibrio alginolyticus TaxID=663 RepID=UPI00227D4428|nr:hypothetical protein [Vibrio alginolyticus]WAG25464.1 hypothetical protein EEA47_03170 [Vibrio alginolyticus]
MSNNKKVERYVDLLLDINSLKKSSRRMIRKAKSPLARNIDKGNVNAIKKAAKDKVFGVLNKEQRKKFCQILCEMKNKIRNSVSSEEKREIVSWAIAAMIGLIDTFSGMMISFLWVVREKIDSAICSCKLDNACSKGGCAVA